MTPEHMKILELIQENVDEVRGSVKDINTKLDRLDGKFVTVEAFRTLRNTVVGVITSIIGYLGFDIGR
jgi:hypothetical protein